MVQPITAQMEAKLISLPSMNFQVNQVIDSSFSRDLLLLLLKI